MLSKVFSYDGFVKYFANTSWMIVEKIIRLVVGIWIGAWTARYLGPGNFGILSYAQSLIFLLGAIASLGLDGILIRELINNRFPRNDLMGTSFFLKLGGSITQFFLLIPLSYLLGNDTRTNTIIFITACSVFFQSGWVVDSFFQSQVQSKFSAISNSLVFLVSSGLKIYLLLSNASLEWFAGTMVLDTCLLSVILVLMYRSRNFQVTEWRFNRSAAVFLLRESWPLIISGLVVSLYMRIDQIMIKELIDVEAVGQYAAAIRISEAWYFLPMQIATSLFPAIVSARKKSVTLYRKRMSRLYSLLIWLSIAIAIIVQMIGKPFIDFLFGQSYAQAATVLVLHIWAGLFVSIGVINSQWFLSRNQQGTGALFTVAGAVTNIILNYLLIPAFGIIGAAAATIISYAGAAFLFPMIHPRTRELFFLISRSFLWRSR